MDYHAYLAALSKLLPASVVHQALAVFGAVTLAYQGVLNGGPAVVKLADKVAGAALRSPARPLVLYFAPNIVKFLDGLFVALTGLLITFKGELEADLAAAQASPVNADGKPKA